VFAKFLDEQTLGSGGLYRYLVYTPVDARFIGLDGQISHQIDRASRLTLFGDYVRADLKDDSDNLPRIPPGRLGVRYDYASGPISANAEYFRTFGQERIASYETRTAGYDMLNATLAYRFEMGGGKKSVELYLRGSNLSNQLAFAHTSFVKDQSPLRGRSVAIGMRHSF
jgi:iron complex outermembrane receptor protein